MVESEEQCRRVCTHILAILGQDGMGVHDLVKVTTYLADRAHAGSNTDLRRRAPEASTE